MTVIGLTGGPGTGKSLAARYLADKGAIILSGDQAGKRAVEEYPAVLRSLEKTFGNAILNTDGTLNRRMMGRIAFSDPEAHQKLNEIVHPRLLKILKSDLKKAKSKLIVIDAALIFEWGVADWCDYILVVIARRDIRLKRLKSQGLSRREAEDRIGSQIPDREKAALADYVIENNGTKASLKKNIDRFVKLLP
ncbi:MAG TPA: dephospho-CoA kinase [candidate division Zixibacteria bacterium]|nr:dephospho-CoA kinase [candidate division Zixibacteria bacterium]